MIIVFPVFSQLRFFVQDVQKSIGSIPEILAQMIKESTDFLTKNFEKRNADLKMELLKDLNDALGRVYDMFSHYFISSNAQNGEKMPLLTNKMFFFFNWKKLVKKS